MNVWTISSPFECIVKRDTSVIFAVYLSLLLRLPFFNPCGELLRIGCGWLDATRSWCSFSLGGDTSRVQVISRDNSQSEQTITKHLLGVL